MNNAVRILRNPTGRSVQLSVSGQQARIVPDDVDEGWLLEIGGVVQSNVDLTDPGRIQYEYLRRIANVLDVCWSRAQPIRILHLGAGALTLPRYIQLRRPGSAQTVVELERELTSLAMSELPLPQGTNLTAITGDARAKLADQDPAHFDAIVLDIYTGSDTATHLTGEDFYRELLDRLSDQGVLLVNIGDDAGLRFFCQQADELETAAEGVGFRCVGPG